MKEKKGFYNNKFHFLHQHISFLEAVECDSKIINTKISLFSSFLLSSGVSTIYDYQNEDHSLIDWHLIQPHYKFFFDYQGNEEIIELLRKSKLNECDFLYTWLCVGDPVIKIKTQDFILNWELFYIAAVEGIVLISEDRSCFLEFTDDYKFHLNSNFEIKPDSRIA